MEKNIVYVITYGWETTDCEDIGFQLINIFFGTEQEAQNYLDIIMAYEYNDMLNWGYEDLRIENNTIYCRSDFGNEIPSIYWSIEELKPYTV